MHFRALCLSPAVMVLRKRGVAGGGHSCGGDSGTAAATSLVDVVDVNVDAVEVGVVNVEPMEVGDYAMGGATAANVLDTVESVTQRNTNGDAYVVAIVAWPSWLHDEYVCSVAQSVGI